MGLDKVVSLLKNHLDTLCQCSAKALNILFYNTYGVYVHKENY